MVPLRSMVLLVLLTAACTDEAADLGPGDRIGEMRLVRGAAEDVALWDFCRHDLGRVTSQLEQPCRVPELNRLRIGPGWRAPSRSALEREWNELAWRVTLDGRPIDLDAFGTLPDTSLASGQVVREWNVTVEGLTGGRHRLRAVIHRGEGLYDTTWVITVLA